MNARRRLMRKRWLPGWVTHPSFWIDVAILAALGTALIFTVVVMLDWR
jgi:hypothetical protein